MPKGEPAPVRFMKLFVPVTESGCWLWTSGVTRGGYSRFVLFNRRQVYGHRYSYELFKGPIPNGLEIDHLCRVRCCVNPDHLEAVTQRENGRREAAAQTHCKRGHQLSGVNLRIDSNRARQCKACDKIRRRRYCRTKTI